MKSKSNYTSSQNWNLWCRLCSKEDAVSNKNLFLNDANKDLKLLAAIAKYFSVNITKDDNLSEMICSKCFYRLTSILAFSELVNKVQDMFTYLSTSKDFNICDIRLKFGITEDDFVEYTPSSQVSFKEDEVSDTSGKSIQPIGVKHETEDAITYNKSETDCSDGSDVSDEELSCIGEEFICMSPELGIDIPLSSHQNIQELSENDQKPNDTFIEEENISKDKPPDAEVNIKKPKSTKRVSCKLCYRKFSGVCYYRQHMKRTHKKELDTPQFECNQCSQTFPTELQLYNHKKKHLPLELKQEFPCVYCEKKFTTPYVMQKHISAVHLNEKPYICEECGIAVKSSSSLKVHMLTHTEDRPFQCSICNKGFKNRVGLKRHIDGHSSNKHICTECGCQLNSKASLKRHMVIHSDEKLHKCDYCGREFKRAEALKHHLILHTGLKPYSCSFCGKTFANGSNCRAHKKKSHPDELAALEASGKAIAFTKNIPKLEQLKAITKGSNNLNPVVSKQSGGGYSAVKKKVAISNCEQDNDWID